MAGLLADASNEILEEELEKEKLTIRRKAREQILKNRKLLEEAKLKKETALDSQGKKLKLRSDLDTQYTTTSGQTFRINKVTEWSKGDTDLLPELKELKFNPDGSLVNTRQDRQRAQGPLKKFIENTVKWPDYVPVEFRNVESFDKWHIGEYTKGTKDVKAFEKGGGQLSDLGHAQERGMNFATGLEPRYSNQTRYQEYIIQEGDTIESISKQTGTSPKLIKENNKLTDKNIKKKLAPGNSIRLQQISDAMVNNRAAWDLEMLDVGGSDEMSRNFKAFEAYISSFASPEERARFLNVDRQEFGTKGLGSIFHGTEDSVTGEAGRFRLENQFRQAGFQQHLFKNSILNKVEPSDTYKAQTEILAKNPLIPDVRKVKTARGYFDKIKTYLTNKDVQREAARLSGQSPNPLMNLAGDFVGTIYDGIAYAANPKDKRALTELVMSGTQLGSSIVGGVLIAIPDPLTGGLGYTIMRFGDRVGAIERMWNINRETIYSDKLKLKPEVMNLKKSKKL